VAGKRTFAHGKDKQGLTIRPKRRISFGCGAPRIAGKKRRSTEWLAKKDQGRPGFWVQLLVSVTQRALPRKLDGRGAGYEDKENMSSSLQKKANDAKRLVHTAPSRGEKEKRLCLFWPRNSRTGFGRYKPARSCRRSVIKEKNQQRRILTGDRKGDKGRPRGGREEKRGGLVKIKTKARGIEVLRTPAFGSDRESLVCLRRGEKPSCSFGTFP